MKFLILCTLICLPLLLFGQKEATTTLSTLIYDAEVPLVQKNKRTHSNLIQLEVSPDFWNQFERIDAVFISAWSGSGPTAKMQYTKDSSKIIPGYEADPVIYFAEKAPGFFTFPRKQAGYGTEIVILENKVDTNCLKRYNKGKIAPRGIYPCMIERFVSTTPVNFFYRYAVPKEHYAGGKCPGFNVMLRCSAKADTVTVDTKIALTVMGKRHQAIRTLSMEEFLKGAILNGMKADGFPLNHARWIAENPSVFFVTKCPICRPVQAALSEYIKGFEQKPVLIPNELLDGLVLGKVEEKQRSLSKIVSRYVEKHFETLGMNEREITDMQTKLEAGRKSGMNLKSESFGPFCPSCDGACRIK